VNSGYSSLTCRANTINIDTNIGTIVVPYLYGSLIMRNNTAVGMPADSVADETHIVCTPRIRHIEDAA